MPLTLSRVLQENIAARFERRGQAFKSGPEMNKANADLGAAFNKFIVRKLLGYYVHMVGARESAKNQPRFEQGQLLRHYAH